MKLNRTIRVVKGKDPVLDLKEYDKWFSNIPKIEKNIHKIMRILCEQTIESVKSKKGPILWHQVVEESEVRVNTARDYKNVLEKRGFLCIIGKSKEGHLVAASKAAVALYSADPDKLYEELDRSIRTKQ